MAGAREVVVIPVKIPVDVYRLLVPVAEKHDMQVHQLGAAALHKLARTLGVALAAAEAEPQKPRRARPDREAHPYVPKPATLARADEVRELAEQNVPGSAIAERLGMNPQTVYCLIDYLGIPRRHEVGRPKKVTAA